ncbi:hypothetical protein [Shewanella sp. 10B]|uniref:hypothetical protein n=1 Tax=Shewanella sp. 10B TaxID=2943322 RepID=UPI00201B344A|nr:hypothetical protein [Shewanella sp. 10B]
MAISETTVRPTDGAVEHPRMDLLRVGEQMPRLADKLQQKELINQELACSQFYLL